MKTKVGFAMCGSFCTISQAINEMEKLVNNGYEVIPIMSSVAYTTDTRFGKASEIINRVESICNKKIIHSIKDAEPIGPKAMTDIMLVAPCTGNTLAKLSFAITDTPVTMAVKSHLRQQKPVLIAVSTNDALGASAQNIGRLLNIKNFFFVPMSQDDANKKPKSIVSHFDLIVPSIEHALENNQLQPIIRQKRVDL